MWLKWFHNVNIFIYIKFLIYLLWSVSCKLFSECLSDFITLTKIFFKGTAKMQSKRDTYLSIVWKKKIFKKSILRLVNKAKVLLVQKHL